MYAQVNSNCIGCGLCTGICPDVFFMGSAGLSEAKADGTVPEDCLDAARDAAASCPVNAIELED